MKPLISIDGLLSRSLGKVAVLVQFCPLRFCAALLSVPRGFVEHGGLAVTQASGPFGI